MNKYIKIILFGLLIWVIPFLVAFFIWDPNTGAPSVSVGWFNALMTVCFMIGLSLAICFYFRGVKGNTVQEGWTTGIIWYAVLVVMDLIVLVGFFGMGMEEFYPLAVTYLSALIIAGGVGHLLEKR